MNVQFESYTHHDGVSSGLKDALARFLHRHLDQYGDPLAHIQNAINYALGDDQSRGGFVVVAKDEKRILGTVVMNNTHMRGYIPEYILVYIAVDQTYRGHGIGKQLIQHAIEEADGDIALHVEPTNPARRLYERLGFTNKYLEMRYTS